MLESSPPPEPGGRILIVDDDATIRSTLARAFELSGYHSQAAMSGPDALRFLRERAYDLMILDMNMPDMDGVEVMARARVLRPDLSIIVLTGYATVTSAIAAVKSDAVDYLTKPTSIHDIVAVAQRTLEKRAQASRRERLLNMAWDALREVQSPPGVTPEPLASNPEPPGAIPKPLASNPEPLAETHSTGESSVAPQEHRPTNNASAHFLRAGSLVLDLARREITVEGDGAPRTATLTEGEAAILGLLMARPDEVLSCRELASALWDYAAEEWEAQGAIRPYIFRLRQKLGSDPEHSFIQTVRGRGYLLSSP